MGRLKAMIPPYDYLKGEELVDRLKDISGVKQDLQLADIYGVPRGTIGTWKQRDLTPYELIIRACLAHGVSLRALALGDGPVVVQEETTMQAPPMNIMKLVDGVKEAIGHTNIDAWTLERYGLKADSTEVIDDEGALVFINTENTSPFSGEYLIDIDGRLSLNKIQRLPGGKLSIYFDDVPTVIDESDVKVVGKVAASFSAR